MGFQFSLRIVDQEKKKMRLIYIFSVKASFTLRSTAGVVIIRRGVCCQVTAKVISCPHREGWEWGWARQGEEWALVLGKLRLREAKATVQQIAHQELEPSAGILSDRASLESHN